MDFVINIVMINSDRFDFKYSTVGEYYKDVMNEFNSAEIDLPEYTGDFLPL